MPRLLRIYGVSDSVYAFSGLNCQITTWNEASSKYLFVALADDSQLQADKLYIVADWEGTVADEYITATLESYEDTWEDLMIAKLQKDGAIAPADDGRVSLVWD